MKSLIVLVSLISATTALACTQRAYFVTADFVFNQEFECSVNVRNFSYYSADTTCRLFKEIALQRSISLTEEQCEVAKKEKFLSGMLISEDEGETLFVESAE